MTNPLPMPPAKPPKVIDGETYRWCRKCQTWKRAAKRGAAWEVCRQCENSRLNESAMLPQPTHKLNAVRRRLNP